MSDCLPDCEHFTTVGGPWGPPEGVAACVPECPCDGCSDLAPLVPEWTGTTVVTEGALPPMEWDP